MKSASFAAATMSFFGSRRAGARRDARVSCRVARGEQRVGECRGAGRGARTYT